MTERGVSPRAASLSAVVGLITLAIVGCKTTTDEPDKAKPAPLGPAIVNPGINRAEPVSAHATTLGQQLLGRMARICDVDPDAASLRCPGHEEEHLADLLGEGKQVSLADALAAVHEALGSGDDKLRTAAAVIAEQAFAAGLGSRYPTPVRVSVAQFDELAQRFSTLAPVQAVKVAPLLVHEGMLAGEESRTFQLLSVTPAVERAGYRHLLVYGRLAQLSRLKSASNKDPTLALEAAALMPAWSAAEQRALCSWAAPQYGDKRPEVRGAAGRALAQCDTGTLERLVAVAADQGRAGDWAPGQPLAFSRACSTREQLEANREFCENVQALLENGVTYAKLPAQTRVDSLEALMSSETWMMDLEVSRLVRQSTQSREPLLAGAARHAAAKLKAVAQAGVRQMMQLPPVD